VISLVSLFNSGELNKTERVCQKLLQSYPKVLIVLNVLAGVLHAQGKLDEAVCYSDKAIAVKPDYAQKIGSGLSCIYMIGSINDKTFKIRVSRWFVSYYFTR